MTSLSRRSFLRHATLAGVGAAFTARSWSQVAGSNGDVRIAVVGLNGKGRDHITAYRAIPGVRVVAICDVDTVVLNRVAATANQSGPPIETCIDMRRLLDRPDIDAISIVTPNHLHAMQAIWCLQAGKDICLEKPVSHNLWEGRQILAAARKHRRIVQVNTQNRSSTAIAEALAWTRAGNLGKVTLVRGLVYKRRVSIGRTAGPVPVPDTINYDLFMGPAPLVPLRRVNFHYDWHWQWATGNGDMVAQGNHQLDVGRRFLGDPGQPARVFTIGGRFGYVDDGETPNTFLVHYDYPTPFIFEVRGLPARPDALSGSAPGPSGLGAAARLAASMDTHHGLSVGNVIHCEGGYLTIPAGNYSLAQAFDRDGKLVREFRGIENHYENFVAAMRSRKESDLRAPLLQGHLSSSLAHLANISHRVGRQAPPAEIREQIRGTSRLAEPFDRFREHLAANEVDLNHDPATWGAPLTLDAATERFVGDRSAEANHLVSRDYREPYVVPALA